MAVDGDEGSERGEGDRGCGEAVCVWSPSSSVLQSTAKMLPNNPRKIRGESANWLNTVERALLRESG